MTELQQKLFAVFQAEQREHVEGIRSILGPEGSVPPASALEEAFRRAHSLKGAARVVDLRPIERLAHRLETLLARACSGKLSLGGEARHVAARALDAVEDWVAALADQADPPEPDAALASIERFLVMESESPGESPASPASASEAAGPAAATAAETIRLDPENLDRLFRSAGLLLAETQHQNLLVQEWGEIGRQVREMEREWGRAGKAAPALLEGGPAGPPSVPLQRFLADLGPQLQALSSRARSARRLEQRRAWALRQLGDQLGRDVRRARMVTAASVLEGLGKMVRDLAREQGKQVEFQATGLDAEADRLVLQALRDPLLHLLRNAVGHGIETPAERERQGKKAAGRVAVVLKVQSGLLRATVEDDGRGIDFARVAEVAARRGLLPQTEPVPPDRGELESLLFRPGFSTAERVTELSGRGIGLSIVLEAARRLRGHAEILPAEGPGARFRLTVPVALSADRLLLVACQDQTYAIPVQDIERLHRVKTRDVPWIEGKPVLTWEGKATPLATLAGLLGLPAAPADAVPGTNACRGARGASRADRAAEAGLPALSGGHRPPAEGFLSVLVLRSGARRLAVSVDAFLGQQEAWVRDLPAHASAGAKTVRGCILLEEGSVCLVLSPADLLEAVSPAASPEKPESKAARKPPEVLVVDDSITTRTLEKSILEAHGYRVRVAVDGVEALSQLRAEPADLVIADLQMPRLDGFGLIEAMKRDPRLASIPVIVVTSMERQEDQERGLALGADAYIVKRKFDQRELLETIRQML